MSGLHVRVGGVFHHAIAPWGDLAYSHDVYGCKEATWGAYLSPGSHHPALTRGALVELMDGSFCAWSGTLAEPDWRSGTFTALGFSRQAEGFSALDGSGNVTTDPEVAVDQAIARGWNVTRGAGIPTTAYSADAEIRSVGYLLTANSDELAQRWFVGADRVLDMAADPTVPTWQIRPGLVDLGNADDEYASTAIVRYINMSSVASTEIVTDAAAQTRFGYKEFVHDATSLGTMTSARANDIGTGLLTKGKARLGWVGGIEVGCYDLLTMGGVPADLSMVTSRQVVRVWGINDDLQWLDGRTYLDVMIGETNYLDGSGVITLAPVGKVTETLAEFAQEAYTMAAAATR